MYLPLGELPEEVRKLVHEYRSARLRLSFPRLAM